MQIQQMRFLRPSTSDPRAEALPEAEECKRGDAFNSAPPLAALLAYGLSTCARTEIMQELQPFQTPSFFLDL